MIPRPPGFDRAVRLSRLAAVRVRNQVTAPGFASRAGDNGMVPNGAVAVFFATEPGNLYQFTQWQAPLEELARTRPVFVIVDRPDTGEQVLATTTLPVAFARGSRELEDLVAERDIRVVLYVNQVEPNFRMLRFPGPVHIQIGHGESDKAGSASNQHKAYDLVFVGGAAGRDRLGHALRGFDVHQRTVPIGRPQLDHTYPGAPDWPPGSGLRVWYAPTWEGDRASIAYGSLVSHGVSMVEALLSDPSIRVIYRPHPRTGKASAAHAAADAKIRGLLEAAGDRHLVDRGGYGWQWDFADACVTDISAVAYDWLATGKPLVITEPAASAYRPASPLLDGLPLLTAPDAAEVVSLLHGLGLDPRHPAHDVRLTELAHHYFGDTADRASSTRFAAAIEQAYVVASTSPRT
ncbi:MAG TPA: CDP-glycerol glycerophosphotransferase family protein [Propionibacteriaceae bacterium]